MLYFFFFLQRRDSFVSFFFFSLRTNYSNVSRTVYIYISNRERSFGMQFVFQSVTLCTCTCWRHGRVYTDTHLHVTSVSHNFEGTGTRVTLVVELLKLAIAVDRARFTECATRREIQTVGSFCGSACFLNAELRRVTPSCTFERSARC